MKIPSIYTESSEEITSVIEKLKASHEPIVALVLPKGSPLGQSIVNLKLIRKAAQDAAKDVIVVSTDSITKNLGVQLGITVVKTEKEVGQAASGELVEEAGDTAVIAGVRIHRYYNEAEVEEAEETPKIPTQKSEPIIIPKNLKKSEEILAPKTTQTNEPALTVEKSPMAKRSIANSEVTVAAAEEIPEVPTTEATPPTETPKDAIPTPAEKRATIIASSASSQGTAKTPKGKRSKWPVFFAILVLILGISAAAVLPLSTVTISIASETFDKKYPFTALPGGSGDRLNASELTTSATSSISFTATGTKRVGTAAAGTATIFNSQDSSPQLLPAGAILSANGRTFTTQAAVTVPGVQVKSGALINGSVTVAVTANEVGPESNLQNIVGTIATPRTALFAQITNTTGGTSRDVTVISAADIAKARESAEKDLLNKLRSQRTEELNKAGETLTSEKAERITTKEAALTKQVGEEAESAEITLEGTLTQSYVVLSDAQAAARAKAGTEDTSGRDLSIRDIQVTSVDANGSEILLTTQVLGSLIPKISVTAADIAGKTAEEMRAAIGNTSGVSNVSIEQTPTWWPSKRTSRIPSFTKILTKND